MTLIQKQLLLRCPVFKSLIGQLGTLKICFIVDNAILHLLTRDAVVRLVRVAFDEEQADEILKDVLKQNDIEWNPRSSDSE